MKKKQTLVVVIPQMPDKKVIFDVTDDENGTQYTFPSKFVHLGQDETKVMRSIYKLQMKLTHKIEDERIAGFAELEGTPIHFYLVRLTKEDVKEVHDINQKYFSEHIAFDFGDIMWAQSRGNLLDGITLMGVSLLSLRRKEMK